MYILLTAVPPFDGEDDKQIIEAVRKLKFDIDIPEMDSISPAAKHLIQKILLPDGKRMTCEDIFRDPWVLKQHSKTPLKVNFSRMSSFAKFSKIKKLAATYIATQLS